MSSVDTYQTYINFVGENSEKIFRRITRKTQDTKNVQPCISGWSKDNTEGIIEWIDGNIYHKEKVSWHHENSSNTVFHFVACECGKVWRYSEWLEKQRLESGTNRLMKGIPHTHIISCLELAKKIDSIDESKIIIKKLLEYHDSRKKPSLAIMSHFDSYRKVTPIRRIEKVNQDNKVNQSVNTLADDFIGSSIAVSSANDFPSLPGIYFIRYFVNGKWNPLYVGKSVDLKSRWKQHHRQNEVNFLQKLDIAIEFRYIAETPLLKFTESLDSIELRLINEFNPKLNRQKLSHVSIWETAQSS